MAYFKKKLETGKRIIGLSELKDNAQFIRGLFSSLIPSKWSIQPGPAQRLKDAQVSPQKLLEATRAFRGLLTIFLILSVLIFSYAVYALFAGEWPNALIGTALTCLLLAQAFRYHFWLFQIHRGKLGCTWQEWAASLLKKTPSNAGEKS